MTVEGVATRPRSAVGKRANNTQVRFQRVEMKIGSSAQAGCGGRVEKENVDPVEMKAPHKQGTEHRTSRVRAGTPRLASSAACSREGSDVGRVATRLILRAGMRREKERRRSFLVHSPGNGFFRTHKKLVAVRCTRRERHFRMQKLFGFCCINGVHERGTPPTEEVAGDSVSIQPLELVT